MRLRVIDSCYELNKYEPLHNIRMCCSSLEVGFSFIYIGVDFVLDLYPTLRKKKDGAFWL